MKSKWQPLIVGTLAVVLSGALSVPAPAALADTTRTSSPIKHLVVIFQENRSFDHYFGTYPSAPGFHPLPGTPSVNGIPAGITLKDQNGNPVSPYLFGDDQLKTRDVTHSYTDMIDEYDHGLMDRFVANPKGGPLTMGYYDYHAIPAYWAWAQHFTLADNWFQPVFGPSTPGALYLVAAQSGTKDRPITGDPAPAYGPGNNKDQDTVKRWYSTWADPLTYKNIGDEMTAGGITWAWYNHGWNNANANPDYSAHHNPFQYFTSTHNSPNLKDYTDFLSDARQGSLPAVSYLKAAYPNDEHPGYSDPSGENWVVSTVNAIMQSPNWKDTAIVITYDESGGYWDHVPPPQVAPGPDGLQGYGPRVPTLVISPYARRNYVSHVQYDHTSLLKFIEWNWNLPALNNRDANANNITDVFDFRSPDFTPYLFPSSDVAPTSSFGPAIKVKVNNFALAPAAGEFPFLRNNRTMVPLADFARNINATVTGGGAALVSGDKVVTFRNGSAEAEGNGQATSLPAWTSPTGRLYVPLRSLCEILGYSVSYNDGIVTVTTG